MPVYEVQTISFRTWDDWKYRQLPVYNLVRVQACNAREALRVAEQALEGYVRTEARDAIEVKGVRRV